MTRQELLSIVKQLIDGAAFDGEETEGWYEDAQTMSDEDLLDYARDLGYDCN